ncbi:hypothetical protein Tco_0867472, partial [Tanacetum coccineum]
MRVKWLPLMANSFAVSGMVITEPGVGCKIDRADGGKLHDKNADESWEVVKNLALNDHEGWNGSKDFVKPVKAIATSQNILKMPDRRLLELEEHINFLLKGPQPAPRASSTHVPQAYTEAFTSNSHPQNLNEPPRQNSFTFRERIHLNPQPLWEEINDKMTEMFRLLKELTASRTPEKSAKDNAMSGDSIKKLDKSDAVVPLKEVEKENEAENGIENESFKITEKKLTQIEEEESVEAPRSQPVGYYLKHKLNKKLVEGLSENQRFNHSLSATQV